MIPALKAFFGALSDIWFHLISFVICNLLTVLGIVLIVPGPPMLVGLLELSAESLRYRERPEAGLLLRAARANAGRAWRLAAILIAGSVVLAINYAFYSHVNTGWAGLVRLVVIVVLALWIGVVVLSGPMMVRSDRGAIIALRNSLLVVVRYPIFSLLLVVFTVVVIGGGILIPPVILLLGLALWSAMMARATRWVLEREGLVHHDELPDDSLLV